ncbi:MAG: glycosyltransferase [Planctomycetota bacterium]
MTLRSTHRIAYICTDPELELGGNGQAARNFCGLARGLRGEGADVAPFVTCRSGAVERTLPGVRVVPPAHHDESDRIATLLDNSRALVSALSVAGPFDMVVEQLSQCGTAGREFARAAAIPLVLRVTERLWEGAETLRSVGSQRVATALCIDVLRAADLISVPHDGLARAITRLGVARSRILIQPAGVDLKSFESATAAPIPHRLADGPSVLTVLERDQPTAVSLLAEAVEALASRRPVTLQIATSGVEASALARGLAKRRPELFHTEQLPVGVALGGLFLSADAVVSHAAPLPGCRSDDLALFGAIATRRPLVVGKSDETVSWTVGIPGVRFFRPCQADDLALALELSLDRDDRSWPATAEHVRSRLDWSARARDLLSALGQLSTRVASHPPSRAT